MSSKYPDGIDPGLELGTRELVITLEWIEKYMGSIDDRNPWYTDNSPLGGPIAPSAVFNYEMELFGGWHPSGIGDDVLNTKQSWEFHRPLRPGQRLIVKGRVKERYEKRGREHITMEASAYDEDGTLVCRTTTTDAWPIPSAAADTEPHE